MIAEKAFLLNAAYSSKDSGQLKGVVFKTIFPTDYIGLTARVAILVLRGPIMNRFEFIYDSVNSESYTKPITALVVTPDRRALSRSGVCRGSLGHPQR